MRRRHPLMLALLCLVAAFAAFAAPTTTAAAEEPPPYAGWSDFLAPQPGTFVPSSEDDCTSGKVNCVHKVIREMTRRFDGLAERCDHNLMFAITYLRTTEEYLRATTTPHFFDDPAFVNHEDAVFAGYYFRPFDAYPGGSVSGVPAAWKIAFDAARDQSITGTGNLLLGVNAHINRDLPYVLAGIGLRKPDGSSRKPDHDKVNEFLNRVSPVLYPELARRFDPTVDDRNLPGWLDDMATFQAFPAMREAAWRNAEELVAARNNPLQRVLVEASIENDAATTAQAIKAATATTPAKNAERNTYCAAHHNDV